MKKISLLLIAFLLIGFLGGCISNNRVNSTNISAEQVIKEHFRYWNDKNIAELEKTMTQERKGISWELNKLEYVKLISIKEKKLIEQKNRKEFEVEFEVKFKNGSGSGLSDGKYTWSYMLKKETENSTWLIYDWGV